MRWTVVGLAMLMTVAGGASAQTLAPLDAGPGVKTCGDFRKLDMAGQVAALASIEPLGDEIDPNDTATAKIWADEVSDACGDDEERPLEDAAAAALDKE